MAAIVLSRLRAGVLLLTFFAGSPLLADRAGDLRTQLSVIATALASANPSEAMAPFDKSCPNFEKISSYFQALTAYQIENEVDVKDEQDAGDSSQLTVTWALTLTDLASNRTDHRTSDINVRMLLQKGKWKIVEFSPINIFNPLPRWDTKPSE